MIGQATPSALDLIPGARAAVNYIMSQVSAFQRVPGRLNTAVQQLVTIKRDAETKGNMGASAQAAMALQAALNLQSQYNTASSAVADAMDQLRNSGLLSGPLDVAAAVLKAAGQLSVQLKGTQQVEDSVKALSAGKQISLGTQGAATPDFIKYAAIGGILYFAFWAVVKGKARGTRTF